ncbi:MAG: ribonuclease H family protein, partial [Bacillota bacterium]
SVLHCCPGRPCYAAYVAADKGQVVAKWCGRVRARDVNHAELRAILEALRWAARQGLRRFKVYTDSLEAAFAIHTAGKNPRYGGIARQIRKLLAKLQAVVVWIPRELNKIADRFLRQAVAGKETKSRATGFKNLNLKERGALVWG